MGTPAERRAPRPKPLCDLEDGQVLVQEDDVDREPHERGVHRPRRPDQHALTAAQLGASEQPAATAGEAVSEVAALADDLPFRADEDERVQRMPPFISARQYRLELRYSRLPIGWSNNPAVSPSGRFEPWEGDGTN